MKIHIVKKGETLYELANKYHVELDEIIALNPQFANPDQISIGAKVKIPSRPKPVGPPAEYAYKHVVQQGDSLWKLGKAWEIPLNEMIKANPQLKNPNVLMTGEIVYIPKLGAGETVTPIAKPSTEPIAQQPSAEQYPVVTPPVAENPVPVAPIAQEPPYEPSPAPAPGSFPQAELPSWNMPQAAAPEAQPQPQAGMEIGLDEPYQQAVHPFKQLHITATEVFAYPETEDAAEAVSAPAWQAPWEASAPAPAPWADAPQAPWGGAQPSPCADIPQAPWEAAGPAAWSGAPQAPWAAAPQPAAWQELPHAQEPWHTGQLPVSDGGCGCGGSGPVAEPWHGHQHETPTIYYPPVTLPLGVPHVPYQPGGFPAGHDGAVYPPGAMSAYEQPQYPYMPYHPAAAEGAYAPQVHTHEIAEETDKEETIEIDIRTGKKSEKAVRSSAKKAKASGGSPVQNFVKRQQHRAERAESKPNLPWINV